MENESNILEATQKLSINQKFIIKSLIEFSQPLQSFGSNKSGVLRLQYRGIVEIKDGDVFLTPLGKVIAESWQNPTIHDSEHSKASSEDKDGRRRRLESRQKKLEKSNEFLELYKQGLTYQDIGEKYNLSRERVRQILKYNSRAVDTYLQEREVAKANAVEEKKERIKRELYSKSLSVLHPERVAELWDHEKNGDLSPEDVSAGSTQQYVWLKCPIDEHSWKKKPNDITTSWTRSGSSGCPVCAGKIKKAEKQPKLAEIYPELVNQYWHHEKNDELCLDPKKLTLASNKKAWFKCPHDDNSWQASIVSTVIQQWSKGNTGCRVCNRTDGRKRGEWKRRESIAIEFPEEIKKYWIYEINNELKLDPEKLRSGSSKEAFFKCPIDGHEWVTTITSITKSAWSKGNSGCPACRGLISTKTTSIAALYPDYVAQYWDHKKNSELGLFPTNSPEVLSKKLGLNAQ